MAQIDQMDDPYPLDVKGNKDRRQKKDGLTDDQEMEEVGLLFSTCLHQGLLPTIFCILSCFYLFISLK